MRWKLSVILLAAMVCLALTGVSAAQDNNCDVKFCWEKPCGTKVIDCDTEVTHVLNDFKTTPAIKESVNGVVYLIIDEERNKVRPGDIRLTWYHTNYPPNTKVKAGDFDVDNNVSDLPNATISYYDINHNGIYDLYDPVYIDKHGTGEVSINDIRVTDIPPVDVKSLNPENAGEVIYTQAQFAQRWTKVLSSTAPDFKWELNPIGSGNVEDLVKYVDVDCSGDWSCADRIYLIQPSSVEYYMNGKWISYDDFVTIGDVRFFVDPADEKFECGTKVQQCDKDATYMLIRPGMVEHLPTPILSKQVLEPTAIYLDMDASGTVSIGDIRLSHVSTTYEPNTKVKWCDEMDLGKELVAIDQYAIKYADIDGLDGYTLGDPLYIDLDGNNKVSAGDIRLTNVPVFCMDDLEAGEIGPMWSVVKGGLNPDADVGWDLETIGHISEITGYIDSDCTGDWTCPDKLYFQQLTGGLHDYFVTIGDHRTYVPPEAIEEEDWFECGTKVVQCNKDLVYVLMEPDVTVKVGLTHQGYYLDMDRSGTVTVGDIRLSEITTKFDVYDPNTKVVQHDTDIGHQMQYKNDDGYYFYLAYTGSGGYNVNSPLYLRTQATADTLDRYYLSPGDLRLSDVPVGVGSIGESYTFIEEGDADDGVRFYRLGDSTISKAMVHNYLMIFDADCSGDWTCPDKLYLQQKPTRHQNWLNDYFVTIGDFRIYMPPMEDVDNGNDTGNGDTGNGDTGNNDEVTLDDVIAAIMDYFASQGTNPTIEEVVSLIQTYMTQNQ